MHSATPGGGTLIKYEMSSDLIKIFQLCHLEVSLFLRYE